MVRTRKFLIGADMGAPANELFPVTKFKTIDQEEISVQDSFGKNTVLLITSTRCSVCKTLYPHIRPFISKHGSMFNVISLMDGDMADVKTVRETHQLTHPIVHVTAEDLKAIKTESFPFGYLLTPEGKIIAKGFVKDGEDLEILRKLKEERQKKRRLFFRYFFSK